MDTAADLTANRRTVAAYDGYAARYAEITAEMSRRGRALLDEFVARVGPDARVLEIASGPGWDADYLEQHGVTVRRTDLSDGFIALQRGRGKTIEPLDLVTGDLGGPWDAILALYVIQHIGRSVIEGVLRRLAAAIRPGGHLLMSFQEGDEDGVHHGSEGGAYHVVRWRPQEMLAMLTEHGFQPVWDRRFKGDDANWMDVIARRS